MRAVWYERQGPAEDVLVFGTLDDPEPAAGEVRIRIAASGINPGDLKKRANAFGIGMPYPRVIPHSDGAGTIDRVGAGVPAARIGERVWCHGAQSYRPFGTAAQYCVVPAAQAIALPDGIAFETGACLGIPGITAHRAVHAGAPVAGRSMLVQGGAGGVGVFAVGLAHAAGARTVATARSAASADLARQAGADVVVRTDARTDEAVRADLRAAATDGYDHVVEAAFDRNIDLDSDVLAPGGSIAAYATGDARPSLPFWPLLFKNARLLLLGSDDFAATDKAAAAQALNALLAGSWQGIAVDRVYPLAEAARAHRHLECAAGRGRVLLAP